MRLSKAERHWQYWAWLSRMSHARFVRHMATWERFYGVWPRGYVLGDKCEDGQLAFEKIIKAR